MADEGRWVADRCPQCGGILSESGREIECPFCGSHLVRRAPAGPGESPAEAKSFVEGLLHLKTYSCVDDEGIGCEAFSLLIPHSWEAEGGVRWPLQNPGMPAVVALRAHQPGGEPAFEVLPSLPFYWSNNPMVTMQFPMGSSYFGNEVRPPVQALQAMREIVVPRYRGQIPGLQIVSSGHVSGFVSRQQAPNPIFGGGPVQDGAKVRIRYRQGSAESEEDLFCKVEITHSVAPSMMGMIENTFWNADLIFAFRAPVGQLDPLSDLFYALVRSIRLNRQWFNRYTQLTQYLTQNPMQQIHHIGQIRQLLSQTNDYMDPMVADVFNQRQAMIDGIASGFSQARRGVDTYADPYSGEMLELPGGYDNVWASDTQEYILTNDAAFDPNREFDATWQRLSR